MGWHSFLLVTGIFLVILVETLILKLFRMEMMEPDDEMMFRGRMQRRLGQTAKFRQKTNQQGSDQVYTVEHWGNTKKQNFFDNVQPIQYSKPMPYTRYVPTTTTTTPSPTWFGVPSLASGTLMVGIGTQDDSNGLTSFEVFNLLKAAPRCVNPHNYPVGAYGATGGLDPDGKPIICGGIPNSPNCYSFNATSWSDGRQLNNKRAMYTSVHSPFPASNNTLFVAGGYDPVLFTPLDSAEMLTKDGWKTVAPLPVKVYFHCMVNLNPTSVMIVAGRQGNSGERSANTWIFNANTNDWSQGPAIREALSSHACGMVFNDYQTGLKSVVVTGGGNNYNQYPTASYFLDEGAAAWRDGPPLPQSVFNGVTVEHPNFGLLLIGGRSTMVDSLATIYSLMNVNSQWYQLTEQLKEPRFKHVAFFVPDDLIC